MKNIALICLLTIAFVLNSKMIINSEAEVYFGPGDVSLYGGIKVDLSKQNYPVENKAAGIYFEPTSKLLFVGTDEDTLVNISVLNSVAVAKNGGSIWLEDNLNILGNLNFTSGCIKTGTDTLNLSLSTSTITGECEQGFVQGNLKSKRYIGTGNSVASGHFGGIGFRINDTGSDLGTVTLYRRTGEGSQSVIQGSDGIKRQWEIETTIPFSGTRNISVNWLSSEDNGSILPILKAWKFIETETGTWEYISGTEFSTTSDPRTATFSIDRATTVTINTGSYFAGGKGTISEPWLIRTAQNLDSIRYFVGNDFDNCYFRQIADIDLGVSPWNEAGGWDAIGDDVSSFKSTYDGDHYRISNLTINRPLEYYTGLFGNVDSSQLKNIEMINADITGFYLSGILSGMCSNTLIENCSVSGEISGDGTVAGLTGSASGTSMSKCLSSASVTSTGYYIGGLIGYNYSYSNVTDCYTTGSVSGDSYVGGLIGANSNSNVLFSYSNAAVSGINSQIGGLIGLSDAGYIFECYWDKQTSGQDSSAAGEGRTTDEMTFEQAANTYVGWDFESPVSAWEINYGINGGYPYLKWQNLPNTNFAGGTGIAADPYLVSNADQLNKVRYYRTKAFKQTADIDLGVSPWNDSEGWDPVSSDWTKPFRGIYDGDHFTISNMTIDRDSMIYNYVSLFGVTRGAQLKKVNVTDAVVAGSYSTGILAGSCDSTSIEDCSVSGQLTGEGSVGSLAGYVNTTSMSRCFSSTDVVSTWSYTGGLVGYSGGYSSATDCYSTGSVSGDSYIGGLIGYNYQTNVLNCYSTGPVSGISSYIGGLIGYSDMSNVWVSYWDTQTSGQTVSSGGEGKTTDDMTYPFDLNTYVNWDFNYNHIWIGSSNFNNGYPYLSWENRNAPTTPQNLTISIASGNVTLSWSGVEGASAYRVYSSVNPYGSFTLDTSGSFIGTQWTAAVPGIKKFYYVKAVNDTKKDLTKQAALKR